MLGTVNPETTEPPAEGGVPLNDGGRIPGIGFGTFRLGRGRQTREAQRALRDGDPQPSSTPRTLGAEGDVLLQGRLHRGQIGEDRPGRTPCRV